MPILCQMRAVIGAIPRAGARRQARKFLAATSHCRETQHRVLKRIVRLNADSCFSRERHLKDVRTPEDFRARLAIADFEDFRPYIEAVKQGNYRALLGRRNKLLMFTLSSGTSAQSKFIPVTEQFLADYRRGWLVWGIRTLDDHAGVNSRRIVQFSSDYDRFRTPGGTPCGNISGLVARAQKTIVRTMYTVPGIVSKIGDPEAKNYVSMRLAVADEHVGMVMTANPSTLIHMARMVDEEKEHLIRDIADGTLSSRYNIESVVRSKLRRLIRRKRRDRARYLGRIAERTGHLYPVDYWPDVQLVAVWTAGSASAYLPSLSRIYPNVPIRDHGLSASEGRMTIPMQDGLPDGVLDISSHYFEFIPEREYGSANPSVLEAHDLEVGQNYYILLTTSSGLYRYDICDVVRCTGFYGSTPMLVFLHKGAHISNITGEKISESQVVAAVRCALELLDVEVKQFTLAPVWSDPPAYQLMMETGDLPTPAVGRQIAKTVDLQLQLINCEYREKRNSGRLGCIEWTGLPQGTWQQWAAQRLDKPGACLEQYKHPCLVSELNFSTRLLKPRIRAA